MTLCEGEAGADAPQAECQCRACVRAREAQLDPELVRMLRQSHADPLKVRVSTSIIYHGVTAFLAGRMTLAEMNFAIIRMLAEQNDKLIDMAVNRAQLSLKRD